MCRRMIERGDIARAERFGWGAVAAGPHSGLAWCALGDALYSAEKWEEAMNVYGTALEFGWRTSALYRNAGIAAASAGHWARARQAITWAREIDPASRRIQVDERVIHDRWLESLRLQDTPGR